MILERIVAVKRQEVERLKERLPLEMARRSVADLPPARGFARALRKSADPVALIAEVKKASPSKGVIMHDFDPLRQAKAYEAAGASCISVLTDETFFQGSIRYLTKIHQEVKLPLLRKDFIIDERQIYEARLAGADAILLITALLSPQQLLEYRQLAESLGMDALVEVHDEKELGIALAAGSTLVGVNNRDLRDFSVDLQTTAKVAKQVPPQVLLVSESGIASPQDVLFVQKAGAQAILVGETLMRADSVSQAVAHLLGRKKRQEG